MARLQATVLAYGCPELDPSGVFGRQRIDELVVGEFVEPFPDFIFSQNFPMTLVLMALLYYFEKLLADKT